ncbi:MAG: peptidoglycan DD-metalloendopeptidase family protein [Anaerolineaceae bacterium]|nr:peptidoglycan DD-metalloendopeptidase family protein [Anaerolineaceae bacterium]
MPNYTNLKKRKSLLQLARLCLSLAMLMGLLAPQTANAQSGIYPEYVVVSGDTLYGIAARFDTTLEDLVDLNAIGQGDVLRPGDHLKIPTLEGMRGVLSTDYVPLGASLSSLSRRDQAKPADLIRLNQFTSPSELFIGREIVVARTEDQAPSEPMPSLTPGQSLVEASILSQQNTWQLASRNALQNPLFALPMDTYYRPSQTGSDNNMAIPGVESIVLDNLPLVQGGTYVLKVKSSQPVNVSAELTGEHPVFTNVGDGNQIAFGGIRALIDPGVYPLTLEIGTAEGASYRFDQYVIINSGNYVMGDNLEVDPSTIESDNVKNEDAIFKSLVAPVTPLQQWEGAWWSPAQDVDCVISPFGSRRTYNGDPKLYYHTGLDLGYCKGTDVYAPARGTVVAVLPDQIVRGNVIVIDHGLGVYSIYMHLSEFKVQEGNVVEEGQLIGIIGTTGRSTGPHLHFEVDIQGIPVNPVTWLNRTFP